MTAPNAGERNKSAKLTEAEVKAIRDSTEGVVACAKRYGVSIFTISAIRNRKRWRCVA